MSYLAMLATSMRLSFLPLYPGSQPTYRYVGARCLELGAGVGLVGMYLAKQGAQVTASAHHVACTDPGRWCGPLHSYITQTLAPCQQHLS
jgi:hypothetical protein